MLNYLTKCKMHAKKNHKNFKNTKKKYINKNINPNKKESNENTNKIKKICKECLMGCCPTSTGQKANETEFHHLYMKIKPDLKTFKIVEYKLYELGNIDNDYKFESHYSKKICVFCLLQSIEPAKFKCDCPPFKKTIDKKYIHFFTKVSMSVEDLDFIINKLSEIEVGKYTIINNINTQINTNNSEKIKTSSNELLELSELSDSSSTTTSSKTTSSTLTSSSKSINKYSDYLYKIWDYNTKITAEDFFNNEAYLYEPKEILEFNNFAVEHIDMCIKSFLDDYD